LVGCAIVVTFFLSQSSHRPATNETPTETPKPAALPAFQVPQPAPEPPAVAVKPAPPEPAVKVAPAAAADKPKRPPRRPAAPPIGLGADSLTDARRAYKAGDYIAAGMQAKRAARQGAGLPAFLLLGDSMVQLESYGEAKEAYQSALELDPGNATAKHKLRIMNQMKSR
jgi:hypothetical protein